MNHVETGKSWPDFLTPPELASYLNMSLKWVETHTAKDRIPGIVRCGRSIRYRKSEIDLRMLNGQILLDK